MTCILAIDPGVTGAMACIRDHDDQHPVSMDLATKTTKVRGKVRTEIDIATLFTDFVCLVNLYHPDAIIIERVGSAPGQGVASSFKFGEAYGIVRAIAETTRIPVYYVTPQEWKRTVGVTKDKKTSVAKAEQIFSGCKFARVKDHNRAEAILLAFWGYLVDLDERNAS